MTSCFEIYFKGRHGRKNPLTMSMEAMFLLSGISSYGHAADNCYTHMMTMMKLHTARVPF